MGIGLTRAGTRAAFKSSTFFTENNVQPLLRSIQRIASRLLRFKPS